MGIWKFLINFVNFPFICRICWSWWRGDQGLEDCLLDLFVTITKIDVQAESKFSRRDGISISITDRNVDNYFDKNAVVDIKEEMFYVPEASISKNFEIGAEFCSETDSVETPLECDPCKNEISTENQLQVISKGLDAKRRFKYCVCEKSFTLERRLQLHSLIHSEKKLFKCDCCEKSFTRRNNLKSHLLTHSGKKPFKCDFCQKSYNLKHVLKSHLLIHTGEKPFKFDFCENSFFLKHVL